jgi:hypothetical protein
MKLQSVEDAETLLRSSGVRGTIEEDIEGSVHLQLVDPTDAEVDRAQQVFGPYMIGGMGTYMPETWEALLDVEGH